MYTLLAYIYPSFVNTKLFWKIVKKRYTLYDDYKPYLCTRSTLFRAYWDQNTFPSQKLAKEFLSKIIHKDVESSHTDGAMFLFYADSHSEHEEVRLLFIDWCINKYSK